MQTSSFPADAIAFGRHRADLPGGDLDLSAYPAVQPLGPTPRTLRAHVGRRETGSFSSVLGTPAVAKRLPATVARLRKLDLAAGGAGTYVAEQIGSRLLAMRDEGDERRRRIGNTMMVIVAAALLLWFGVPVTLTFIAGTL